MPEPVKVNVVSYGGVKPGQLIVGNGADGTKTTLFDAATATNGYYMFYRCTKLTSFSVALPNLTNGDSMFYNCTSLTSFTGDLSSLTDGDNMFNGCTGLTSWTVDLPNLTNGSYMFYSCTGLTSWNANLPNLTNGSSMFHRCTSLTSWNVALPNLTNGSSMFNSCNLDEASVLRILNSIPTWTSGTHQLHLGKRTNYLNSTDIATLLSTTTPIAAKTNYSYKGWTITITT